MKLSEKIKQLYSQGMRKTDIARELGIGKGTVSKHTPRKSKILTESDIAKIKRMYVDDGMTITAIADAVGCCAATVSNYLKDVEKRARVRKPRDTSEKKPRAKRKYTAKPPKQAKLPKLVKPRGRPQKVEAKKETENVKQIPTLPAIKEGTRPILVKPGLIVHARIGIPEEDVRAKYLNRSMKF